MSVERGTILEQVVRVSNHQFENVPEYVLRLRQEVRSKWARLFLIGVLGIAAWSACKSGGNQFSADDPATFPTPNAEFTLTLNKIRDVNIPNGDDVLDTGDKREMLKQLGEGCIECADVDGNGELDDKDLELLRYNVSQGSSHPRDDPNGDRKFDEKDEKFVEKVREKFGNQVPGGGIFRGRVAYVANAVQATELLKGTTRDELEQIAKRRGWDLEYATTFVIPDETLEQFTLDELIDQLEAEEAVVEADRITIGTTN